MASQLPTFPRILFTILEPISFVAGFVTAIIDPVAFVEDQVPQAVPSAVTENSVVLAWQLGNAYLLLAFLAVGLFTSTSEIKVIRHYLIALALGDIGHVGWSCYGLGMERLMAPGSYNAMAYGNIFFTIFLFFTRVAYLVGFFGPDAPSKAKKNA